MGSVEGSENKFRCRCLGQHQKLAESRIMIGQDLWERQEDETYRVNIMGQELISDQEDETYRVNIVGQEMFSDQLKMMDGAQRKVMSQNSQEVAAMAGHQVALQEEPLLFVNHGHR